MFAVSRLYLTRNSSGDEIANVNFLYDDIVHTLQNTIDWCIATFRHRSTRLPVGLQYVSEHKFTKFSEITQCNGHYAVQGFWYQSKAHIYDFLLVINTNLPPILTFSTLWLIIGQIFASMSGAPHFNALAGVMIYRQKLDSLSYISAAESIGVSSTTFK